jgi:hypothetical protein
MEITSPSGKVYVIGDEVGKEERFKLYHCRTADDNVCILKIARQPAFNGLLDREACLLDIMKGEAKSLEEEYQKETSSDKFLNYHFFFPRLVETFISPEQGNSRISILSLAHVAKDLRDLTPLSHFISREKVRVDPQTSAWVLGKLLKLLVFTHSQNISLADLSGENILLNRSEHYVTIFDWTQASIGNGEMEDDAAIREISQVAKEVGRLLGADPITERLPQDKQLKDDSYEHFLRSLIHGSLGLLASDAHRRHYELIRAIWPRTFHKFTSYPLT